MKEYLKRLKKYLQGGLKGDVSCHVLDDTLIVEVSAPNGKVLFYDTIQNFSKQVATYPNALLFAENILQKFKTEILSRYFKLPLDNTYKL